MSVQLLHRSRFGKFPLALAAIFDLLAGGFSCYVGEDPLVPFLAYALGVAALYMEKLWVLAAFVSLGLSMYGVAVLRGEPVTLLIVAAVFKCVFPFFKGWLFLKSEVRGLVSVVGYLRENPQSLFIFPFIVLLALAAVKFAAGDSVMADMLAAYAYYQLAGGVFAALIVAVREGGGLQRSENRRRV